MVRNKYFEQDIKADFLIVCGGPKNAVNMADAEHFFDRDSNFLN